MTPPVLIAVTSIVLLLSVGITLLVLSSKSKRDRIKNYSCAEAQLVTKNAQKAMHRKVREHANKMLYQVLAIIDDAAKDRKCEVTIDTTAFENTYFKFVDAKKYRNAVKDSLRSRGFRIVPDTHHKEELIHISWETSHAGEQ